MDEHSDSLRAINDPHQYITEKCRAAGTDISKVCRRAKIDRTIISRWKTKPPRTLIILGEVLNVIEVIKSERPTFKHVTNKNEEID